MVIVEFFIGYLPIAVVTFAILPNLFFPINYLSRLNYFAYVDIVSVITELTLKCFLILLNRLIKVAFMQCARVTLEASSMTYLSSMPVSARVTLVYFVLRIFDY